jgi:hypothetical protein
MADLSLIHFTPHPRHYRKDSLHGNSQLSSSPISLLASELLHEIFSSLASRGLFQLRHALFVCKRWHDVITSNKKLWSTIVIDEETMVRFKLRDHQPEISRARAYIRACLERSAPLPIDVTIIAPFLEKTSSGCSMILGELFKSGKPRHIQRCRSLSWCTGYSHKDAPMVATLFPESFESLEYLFLKHFSVGNDPSIRFPQCPRLKEVHLYNYNGSHYFPKRDHPHVEKLTHTTDYWADSSLRNIQRFQRIRALVLEDTTPDSSSDDDVNFGPRDISIAHLHCLETLKLIGSIPSEIMQCIRAPILRRVDIVMGNSAPQSHVLNTLPLDLLQSVIEIGISIGLSDPETPQHLRRVICGAPSLISLFGTLEIGELLAGEGWFRERGIVYHSLPRDHLDLPSRERELEAHSSEYDEDIRTNPAPVNIDLMMLGPLQFIFDQITQRPDY